MSQAKSEGEENLDVVLSNLQFAAEDLMNAAARTSAIADYNEVMSCTASSRVNHKTPLSG